MHTSQRRRDALMDILEAANEFSASHHANPLAKDRPTCAEINAVVCP